MTSASTIVSVWSYSIDSYFSAATLSNGSALPIASSDTLAWGNVADGAPQSSLVIDSASAAGNVDTMVGSGLPTGSEVGTGSTITHHNFPVGDPLLTSATLQTTLTLEAITPSGAPGSPGTITTLSIPISFNETSNFTAWCLDATSPVPCNDIFVIDMGLLNHTFEFDADGSGLVEYYVNVFPTMDSDLTIMTDPAICGATGETAPCLGFTTIEEQSNVMSFGFSISTNELMLDPDPDSPPTAVPAPRSLALIGLGLIMIGFVKVKRGRVDG